MAEFKSSYEEAVEIIRSLFPNAKIIVYRDAHFEAAFETMTDVLEFHAEETEFLKGVAPLIRENVSENSLQSVCDEILTMAADNGLSFRSLPLLASLSCLYEDPKVSGYNAARELLKLRGGPYTDERAYNVLSDMRGLMFYLAFQALAKQVGEEPLAYCTADKAALLFGCGLNFHNVEFRGNQLFLSIELSEFYFLVSLVTNVENWLNVLKPIDNIENPFVPATMFSMNRVVSDSDPATSAERLRS